MAARFQMVEYADAQPEVQEIYDETMRELALPFVLNWFKCQGDNATLLRGNWEKMRHTMIRGNIPFILKQLIIYNISNIKGCQYCTHVHGLMANGLASSITTDTNTKITDNLSADFIPSSYKTAIRIVTKCAMTPKQTLEDDFEDLRDEGFSINEIQELMALADFTNMVNTIADISGIQIDNELMEVN
ncbi:MAG TPA: hypothetical protein VG738_11890 [Chitinophagaceae bacterium]|nr:hypothetical protein [Chitinophagaceae bacterium]